MARSIGPGLRHRWQRLSSWPGGKWLFSRVLGLTVPYTGSLGASVHTLTPGHCVVVLNDRRKVRNHLQSVHAMALGNLGEMVTGLALLNSLPDRTRGILTGISIQYLKKARGILKGECRCGIPDSNVNREMTLTGTIRDLAGDTVATVEAHWLIGPEKEMSGAH